MDTQITVTGEKPVWSRIANIGQVFCEEATLAMDNEKMKLVGVDGSHVAMWELEIPSEAFNEYDSDTELGDQTVPLDIFQKSLKIMKPKDLQSLIISEEEYKLVNAQQELWVGLDKSKPVSPRTPDLDKSQFTSVVIPTDWLVNALVAAKEYTREVLFSTDTAIQAFCLTAISGNGGRPGTTMKYTLLEERGEKPPEGNEAQKFNITHVLPLIRKLKAEKCREVKLSIKAGMPLLLTARWDDGTRLAFFLAPWIQN